MQLLIADPTYADWQGDRDELVGELESALRDLGAHDLERGDIGPGADWPMFVAIFSGVGTVFLLGERIEKSLSAWISLGRKLSKLIAQLRGRFGATRVDAIGASLLALRHISESEKTVQSVTQLAAETIPIYPFEGRDPKRLDSRYSALYVQVYEVNAEWIYVFCYTG
jgi:hypothetical protein